MGPTPVSAGVIPCPFATRRIWSVSQRRSHSRSTRCRAAMIWSRIPGTSADSAASRSRAPEISACAALRSAACRTARVCSAIRFCWRSSSARIESYVLSGARLSSSLMKTGMMSMMRNTRNSNRRAQASVEFPAVALPSALSCVRIPVSV